MKKSISILMSMITALLGMSQSWQTVGDENFISTGPFLTMEVNDNKQYIAVRNPQANVKVYDPTFWTGWRTVGNADLSDGLASNLVLGFGNNTPYIVYTDYTNAEKVVVKKLDGNVWTTVGTSGISAGEARYTDIAFDGATPYVVFKEVFMFPGDIVVKKFDGTTWQNVGNLGFSDGETAYSQIEIVNGEPYVLYKDFYNSSKATLKKFDGTDWVTVGQQAFTAGGLNFLKLAFDGTTPYVAYRDEVNGGKVTVMMFDGTDWITVGNAGFSPEATSSLDLEIHAGEPYVIFNKNMGDLKASVMRFDGTDWVYVGGKDFSNEDAYLVQLEFINDIPVAAFSGTTVMQLCSPLNTTVNQSGTTLTADETQATQYQWGLCNNGVFSSEIAGETNASFSPQFLPNTFALTINQWGCIDTSTCITVDPINTSIDDVSSSIFSIFPNPTPANFEIQFSSVQNKVEVQVLSPLGNLVMQQTYETVDRIPLELTGSKGIYFVVITDDNNKQYIERIVKN